ncbi:MAG: diguanylate cyclase [gamma proteobacterium symbiont of Taylorina sp.]|nr:diguanylate cyclase [gamma proteobacterium symbiont of Taylorina sp.]
MKNKILGSIRKKLIFILSIIAVIAITLTTTTMFTYISKKRISVDKSRLVNLSNIMGENLLASLSFDDRQSAVNTLYALKVDNSIDGAFLLKNEKSEFAIYIKNKINKTKFKSKLFNMMDTKNFIFSQSNTYIDDENIIVSKPLYLEGEYIGSLFIVSNKDEIKKTLKEIIYVLSLVFIILILITLLMASKLQKIFTDPIFVLTTVMKDIETNYNYEQNISISRNDEFQILFDGFNKMIKTIQEQNTRLKLLADTDPMTHLYNRRYLTKVSESILDLAKRNETDLSVLMLDIDKFKNINDTYGHNVGDDAIISLAIILQEESRKSDILSRWGGEEFVILLPATNIDGALVISEKIRTVVEELVIKIEDVQELKFTVSIGVSQINKERDVSIENSINRADKALYEAKESGRNKVCIN